MLHDTEGPGVQLGRDDADERLHAVAAVRTCRREHREYWTVTVYRGRRRAGRFHASALSTVTCTAPGCGRVWRTDAAYVKKLRENRADFQER